MLLLVIFPYEFVLERLSSEILVIDGITLIIKSFRLLLNFVSNVPRFL